MLRHAPFLITPRCLWNYHILRSRRRLRKIHVGSEPANAERSGAASR